MAPSMLQDLATGITQLRKLTVEEYHRMIDAGILKSGEPYELIDGVLVLKNRSETGGDPMTVGHDHIWVVMQLIRLLGPRVEALGCHFRPQQPISLPPDHEPEPDGAIVRGSIDDYRKRIPGAIDVCSVIEVADASLRGDRGAKLRAYADGGIVQYVIVNLLDRVVEVYQKPVAGEGRFAKDRRLSAGEKIAFAVGEHEVVIQVNDLLP